MLRSRSRPVPLVSAEVRVRRARDVFKQLKYPGGSVGLVTGADVLGAEGLAFTFVSKAGAVVSGMVGHGFVFRKARSVPT